MTNKIKLGYEVGTGKEVAISPSHLIVTGLTQQAGKTTCLESLIKRSGMRAIVFRTKIGEKSFLQGTIIPPYFKDKSDWQFIQGLVEATIKEKLRSFERAKIIQICKQTGGNSLLEFKKRVDDRLLGKLNGFEMDILTNLQAYLEIVLPKLLSIKFSNKLELVEGLNIIDLERFSRDPEVQSLVIRSVVEEVLHNFKNVIVVIPESWKFIPQDRGNPCKQVIEEFIRQGATNENWIWIDSQDMTGVDKTPLKQISTWILGYQSEKNEVKHTLDQIPLPKASRPKEDDIMTLRTGEFYLATREHTIKTYVQPFWLDDKRAIQVAKGDLKVTEIDAPETLTPFKIAIKQETITAQPTIDFQETSKRFNKELSEMGTDFFNKIADVQEQINKLYTEIYNIKMKMDSPMTIDEDAIIRKVLQKLPQNNTPSVTPVTVDIDKIMKQVMERLPAFQFGNTQVYEIAPLEKLKKDFLEEAKNKVLADIAQLSDKAKKVLKYVESRQIGVSVSEITTKCLMLSMGGAQMQQTRNLGKELQSFNLVKKDDKHAKIFGNLKDRIKSDLQLHGAADQEVEAVYNHVLMELL